jgi:hypothetical protein
MPVPVIVHVRVIAFLKSGLERIERSAGALPPNAHSERETMFDRSITQGNQAVIGQITDLVYAERIDSEAIHLHTCGIESTTNAVWRV